MAARADGVLRRLVSELPFGHFIMATFPEECLSTSVSIAVCGGQEHGNSCLDGLRPSRREFRNFSLCLTAWNLCLWMVVEDRWSEPVVCCAPSSSRTVWGRRARGRVCCGSGGTARRSRSMARIPFLLPVDFPYVGEKPYRHPSRRLSAVMAVAACALSSVAVATQKRRPL